jgi:hypothetical protein
MKTIAAATILSVSAMMATNALADNPDKGRGSGPVIYVTSQALFYDSIVLTDLPMKGPFQKLEMGPMGLTTEFGPGSVGYVGGRWWLDLNDNNEMDEGDAFFMCPLLGPGRLEP